MTRKSILLGSLMFIISAAILSAVVIAQGQKTQKDTRRPLLEVMGMLRFTTWYGHDAFKIVTDKVIYFDPYKLKGELAPADIILISHPHYDHCSPEDVKKIQKKDTIIITTLDCSKKLTGKVRTIAPGEKMKIGTLQIEAVPAYSIGKEFHPKANGWVGFIVTNAMGIKVYFAGDTDLIPEMKNIKADLAFLPVSGTYVMTAAEAAQAADIIKPQVAVPMHYGTVVGTEADAIKFKSLTSTSVHIFKPAE